MRLLAADADTVAALERVGARVGGVGVALVPEHRLAGVEREVAACLERGETVIVLAPGAKPVAGVVSTSTPEHGGRVITVAEPVVDAVRRADPEAARTLAAVLRAATTPVLPLRRVGGRLPDGRHVARYTRAPVGDA